MRHMNCARAPPIRGGVLLIAARAGTDAPSRPAARPERNPARREKPLPGRVFAASRLSIDEILARPYDRDVPMGCTGDRVWASSPQGWAFRDDVHWLYLTNLRAFDLEVRDEHGLLVPDRRRIIPSHIHYEGVARKEMTASASFTFALDNVENPLDRAVRAAQALDVLVERPSGRIGTRSTSGRPGRSRASTSISSTMPRGRMPAARSRSRCSGSTDVAEAVGSLRSPRRS